VEDGISGHERYPVGIDSFTNDHLVIGKIDLRSAQALEMGCTPWVVLVGFLVVTSCNSHRQTRCREARDRNSIINRRLRNCVLGLGSKLLRTITNQAFQVLVGTVAQHYKVHQDSSMVLASGKAARGILGETLISSVSGRQFCIVA
jgi:hypothetical protein